MFWLLLVATFASEDAASLAAGALIAGGEVGTVTGVLAIGMGIYVGDLGLYAIGRFTREWSQRARRNREIDGIRGDRGGIARTIDQHAATAIVASRFLPGTRLALYLAAGATGVSLTRFAGWSFLAVGLWTPLVVGIAAGASTGASTIWPDSWLTVGLGLALAFAGLRTVAALATHRGRQRAIARLSQKSD